MTRSSAALLALVITASGCESRERTRNSAGNVSADHGELATSVNVYRFVGVDKALKDARKAADEQRWGDALAAANALLEKQPDHIEARKLAAVADIEARSQPHFIAFREALDRSGTIAGAAYQKIDAASRYRAEGLADYERVREQWTLQRENEARNLASAGRCRDAHRVARLAGDSFPEVREQLEAIAVECRPRTERDTPEVPPPPAPAPTPSPPVASLQPVPPPTTPPPVPQPVVVPRPAAPAPTTVATTTKPAPALTPPPVTPPPAAPPTPAVAPAKPKLVPAVELEKYRIAGDRRPSLPAGAIRIAMRDRVERFNVGVSLCLSDKGEPTTVKLIKPSVYDDANEKILADVRKWRFKPYLINGQAAPVCTGLLFIYQLE